MVINLGKEQFGHVFWITGLSGAGKTYIGKHLHQALQKMSPTLFLDGDSMRQALGQTDNFNTYDRLQLATIYSNFCELISSQGFNVVCSTISMFDKIRDKNRNNIHNYHEIYLKVPVEVLRERDQKKLYSSSNLNNKNQVVGIDLPFEEPKNPDLIFINDGSKSESEIVQIIIDKYLNSIRAKKEDYHDFISGR